MAALSFVRDLITRVFGEKTYEFTNPDASPKPKKTGPGFTEPMQQPYPKKEIVKTVKAAEEVKEDLFAGYNKSRGLPPKDIESLILSSAKKYKIEPSLLAAVLFNESGFNPKAVNENVPGNIDRGIAQINSIAYPNVTDQQAYDPNFAVDFAGRLLRQNIDHFNDISRGIAAYNVGRGGANIRGPEPFGGGPTGQQYINRVSLNLTPDFAQQLGIKFSEGIFDQ